MKIGSDEHKERFCRDFIASHCRFDPATLIWPDLDDLALERLRAIPFWEEVLYTERRAGALVNAYAQTIADPAVRDAVALQGFEEARHAELLREMIRRYGIAAEERPLDEPLSPDLRRVFADFGYGECLDSFLGFGVFKIARRSAFLPERLFEIFDMLMREETRHIVFFINWMAWQQAARGGIAGRLARRKCGLVLRPSDWAAARHRATRPPGERWTGLLGHAGERLSRRLHAARLCRRVLRRTRQAHEGVRA